MVNAVINISDNANQTLNIVKAKYGLRDKSHAIELVVREYAERLLEPQFRPEFVSRVKAAEAAPKRKVVDVDSYFALGD